jgi:hypothetical protein
LPFFQRRFHQQLYASQNPAQEFGALIWPQAISFGIIGSLERIPSLSTLRMEVSTA